MFWCVTIYVSVSMFRSVRAVGVGLSPCLVAERRGEFAKSWEINRGGIQYVHVRVKSANELCSSQ